MKMMQLHACVLLALGASSTFAQQVAADPADPSAQGSPVSYVSPLPAALPAATTTPDQAWKAANREVAAQATTGHGHHGQLDHSQHGAQVDHSKMDHSQHGAQMDHSKMDHSKMDHSKMDHSKMDHSKMDHSKMDHSKMDHSKMDHSKMDHSQHGTQTDHSQHTGHKEGQQQ